MKDLHSLIRSLTSNEWFSLQSYLTAFSSHKGPGLKLLWLAKILFEAEECPSNQRCSLKIYGIKNSPDLKIIEARLKETILDFLLTDISPGLSPAKRMLNINENTRGEIKNILQPRKLSSVFISYSFADRGLVHNINEYLKKKGVATFLWEIDALGGQKLKTIMKSNIDSKERLLFISSSSSLKSEACHFELSEGRRKQNQLWRTVLFPIHIDNFLFEVERHEIPRIKRNQFWENIEELREIHSLNFSEFKKGVGGKRQAFQRKMELLIDSLKIEG